MSVSDGSPATRARTRRQSTSRWNRDGKELVTRACRTREPREAVAHATPDLVKLECGVGVLAGELASLHQAVGTPQLGDNLAGASLSAQTQLASNARPPTLRTAAMDEAESPSASESLRCAACETRARSE